MKHIHNWVRDAILSDGKNDYFVCTECLKIKKLPKGWMRGQKW
jgi:hypothetical protein